MVVVATTPCTWQGFQTLPLLGLSHQGGLRLVTDLAHLNRAVQRPTHPFQPVNDILSSIEAGSKYFITLDCLGGYWQIALSEKSQKLVVFLKEWGRLTYLWAHVLGDVFCHR